MFSFKKYHDEKKNRVSDYKRRQKDCLLLRLDAVAAFDSPPAPLDNLLLFLVRLSFFFLVTLNVVNIQSEDATTSEEMLDR